MALTPTFARLIPLNISANRISESAFRIDGYYGFDKQQHLDISFFTGNYTADRKAKK